MSRQGLQHMTVLQATIEFTTALSIGSGRSDGQEDAPVVLDAYGLPTIPGTSIAGVLRSLHGSGGNGSAATERDLFGFAEQKEGASSRLEISNGFIHGSDDQPAISPNLNADGKCRDRLLSQFQKTYRSDAPRRQRVKINDLGVSDAKATGLFNRSVVPRGTRFSFEICLWSSAADAEGAATTVDALITSLESRAFRLGGATRAGLGGVKLIRVGTWRFDLSTTEGYNDYCMRLPELQTFAMPLEEHVARRAVDWKIKLSARDFWRIGNSERAWPDGQDAKDAKLAPFTEEILVWKNSTAEWKHCLLIPASSIKGALRHRTAFHYSRLTGAFVEPDADAPFAGIATDENEAVQHLFGSAKKKTPANKDKGVQGHRGTVIIDDAMIEIADDTEFLTMVHNSIDRFTGGTRNRFLYGEQLVWRNSFRLDISVLNAGLPETANAEKALRMALDDLAAGRLAIGAGGGRGHGRFGGQYV